MDADASIGSAYLDEVRRSMRGHKRMAEGAIAQLSDEELFRAIDPESNSVAVIMQHVTGSMRSRFTDLLTSDGEKPDRHRDREFEINAQTTRAQLLERWEQTWTIAFDTVASLKPEDLLRGVTVRGEPHSVLQAIHRQVAHYAQHCGQIVFLAKHLAGARWKTLSIPRGQSQEFNAAIAAKSGSKTA